ncbi:MAG: hypothetical protein K2Q32_08325 [Alphaproteobacteria bacterium]|nr:hypothetical protein [Alphaproteobacteria bacterium]
MKLSMRIISLAVMAALLLGLASINLFSNFRSVAAANDQLANKLNQSDALDFQARLKIYAELRAQQEALLIQNPIEPYAWMRLAYLRSATQGNRRYAFEALRFADAIAQPDNVGGLERILMWHDYASVQTEAERKHEQELWQTAYRLNWYSLFDMATYHHLLNELKSAIMEDPELAARWNKTHQ